MFSREDAVHNPGYGTFEWIHETPDGRSSTDSQSPSTDSDEDGDEDSEQDQNSDSSDDEELSESDDELEDQAQARSMLLLWLSAGHGLLHISEKSGSGKSTLMKLIAHHPTTHDKLEKWSGKRILVISNFFAWRAGDDMQQSLHGLYRSLLFSVLANCSTLIRDVFPAACRVFDTTPFEPHVDEPYFRFPSKLNKAFQNLINVSASCDICFCFMIDGLDEFKDDPAHRHSHADLVEQLRLWAQHANIKVPVSSRPETAFLHLVPSERRINLHKLTRNDILTVARKIFEQHSSFDMTRSYYKRLVNDVVCQAEGVFLWAYLMILQLREAAAVGDNLESLQELLLQTPSDLNNLYTRLLRSIDGGHRDMVLKMLFVAASLGSYRLSKESSLLAMTWTKQLFDPQFPLNSFEKVEDWSEDDIKRHKKVAEHRVAQTRGLLEIHGGRVTFFHRTAFDFFHISREREQLSIQHPNLVGVVIHVKFAFATLWHIDHPPTWPGDHPGFSIQANLMYGLSWHDYRKEKLHWLDVMEKVSQIPQIRQRRHVAFPGRCIAIPAAITDIGTYSHLHYLAAIPSTLSYDDDEMIENVKQKPQLMHGNGTVSLLHSAFRGNRTRLIFWLFKNGVSSQGELRCEETTGAVTVPVWVLSFAIVAWNIISNDTYATLNLTVIEMVEALVETGRADLNHFVILTTEVTPLEKTMAERGTHFISFKYLLLVAKSTEDILSPKLLKTLNKIANSHATCRRGGDELDIEKSHKEPCIESTDPRLQGYLPLTSEMIKGLRARYRTQHSVKSPPQQFFRPHSVMVGEKTYYFKDITHARVY